MSTESALVAGVTAAVFSPRTRETLRRGAVLGVAGALKVGDVVTGAARGATRGVRGQQTAASGSGNSGSRSSSSRTRRSSSKLELGLLAHPAQPEPQEQWRRQQQRQLVVMSSNGAKDTRPAEERAEELMERVVTEGSRFFGKVFGRVREEVEDIVAEARSMHEQSRSSGRK